MDAVVEQSEVVSETPAVEPVEVTRDELESKVSAKMADVFKDADADETVEETPADPKADTEETPAAEKTEDEQKADEAAAKAGQTKAPEASTPGTKPNPAATVVPAAYRRSLKAYEWTDEEIDAAAKADPATFLKTAAKLHATRNEETRRMSDLGRQLKAQQATQNAPGGTATPPATLTKVDIAALKKQYGDEPFVAALEQFNGLIDFVGEVRPFMEASQKRQQAAELESLNRQIDGYFGSKDMESYHDAYGKTGATLSDKQLSSRQQVLETADLLISGARAMGRSMTLDQALTLAHDSVSGPIKEQAATKKIVLQVQARQAAISLKPTGRTAVAPKAGDRRELQKNVKAGLVKAFG